MLNLQFASLHAWFTKGQKSLVNNLNLKSLVNNLNLKSLLDADPGSYCALHASQSAVQSGG